MILETKNKNKYWYTRISVKTFLLGLLLSYNII